MGNDGGEIWRSIMQIHFAVKMDDHLHYKSPTLSVKRADKRRGSRVCDNRIYEQWTWWLSDGLPDLQ